MATELGHEDAEELQPTDCGGFADFDGEQPEPAESADDDSEGSEVFGTALAVAASGGAEFVPRTQVEHAAAFFCRLLRWLAVPAGRKSGAEHDAAIATRVEIALFLIAPEASSFESLADIGRRFGLSRERVRQLADTAFPKHVKA